MKEGILEILNSKSIKGINRISAGNYGGKLGPYLFNLRSII
jgi:formylmethanofuran--tetrahydromethanopterin N-formyltransferase